ncbi:MAG TPA: TetR/AcrR family transcriptional regulator [Acidimicrobiales bacterium]|nr:TetR/AcrR family transcriptional regulator [Acidimicrobiales bacterium]
MAVPGRAGGRDTASQILDVAERLVQTRGFNAFSYGDVAAEVGVTKPALHYHFAGKAELGEALVARYAARFQAALEHIDATTDAAAKKLAAYADLYQQVLMEDRMCLCGMLAADYDTLPDTMRHAVVTFFDRNETWLAGVLEQGIREGTLRASGPSREIAQMVIGTLEGAMLVARTYHDSARFVTTAKCLLAELARGPGS